MAFHRLEPAGGRARERGDVTHPHGRPPRVLYAIDPLASRRLVHAREGDVRALVLLFVLGVQ